MNCLTRRESVKSLSTIPRKILERVLKGKCTLSNTDEKRLTLLKVICRLIPWTLETAFSSSIL